MVVNLMEQRGMPLAALVRGNYALHRAVIARVAGLNAAEASGGKLLFLMAVLKDDQGRDVRAQIQAKIAGGA